MSETTQATTLAPMDLVQALPGDAGQTGEVTMTPLSQTELARLMSAMPQEPPSKEDSKAHGARHAATQARQIGYTPVFGDKTRTVVYVLALLASVLGLGLMTFGHPDIGGFISTAAGIIAAGFGVTYNPVRMTGK